MHYIHFSRGIDDNSVRDLLNVLSTFANDQDRDVLLLINSGGGSVVAGIHCFNVMRSLAVNLTTHNVGNVDSIANVIFLAGENRIASPPSTFMFHSVGVDINVHGVWRGEESNLRQLLDSVVADNQRIARLIADRTKLTNGRAGGLFRAQRTHDVEWALKNGFIHSIAPPVIPAGTDVVWLV